MLLDKGDQMTAFHNIGAAFFEKTSLFDTSVASSMIEDLKPVAAAILAILLIWRFIEVMTGSSKKPLEDTALEVMIWAIIWGFVFEVHYLQSTGHVCALHCWVCRFDYDRCTVICSNSK